MEPKFQSSFIPKNASQETAVPKEVARATGPSESGGLWSFIASTIFTLAIIASILVFGAKWYLNRNIESMNGVLSAAREELAPERIQEINRNYDRIVATQKILSSHVTLSSFFEQLQSMLVKNMKLNDLSLSMISGKGVSVNFKGEAVGYVAVAQASDIFAKSNVFKSHNFYDLDLNERGAVLFSFKGEVNPAVIQAGEENQ